MAAELRFEHQSAVALADIVVLVPAECTLPAASGEWPVRFARATETVASLRSIVRGYRHIVLCGGRDAVETLLQSVPLPLYLVTDSPHATLHGRLNLSVPSLSAASADKTIDWEPAVAAICARHLRGVARMIADHARLTPNAEAACDEHGSVTYAELCSMACALGETLESRVPACRFGGGGSRLVGVLLSPSILSVAALLGLILLRLTPCDIAEQPATRKHMLESAGCVALLAEADVDGVGDAGYLHGVPLVRVDTMQLTCTLPLSRVPLPPAAALGDAHIIGWTSGSTGLPKAMAVTNFRIAHWSRWRTYHTVGLPCGASNSGHTSCRKQSLPHGPASSPLQLPAWKMALTSVA